MGIYLEVMSISCPRMACPQILSPDVTFTECYFSYLTEIPVLKRQKVSIILFFVLKNLEIIQRPAQFLDLMKGGVSLISSRSRTTDSRHGFESGLCDSISHNIHVVRSLLVNTTRLFSVHTGVYIPKRY